MGEDLTLGREVRQMISRPFPRLHQVPPEGWGPEQARLATREAGLVTLDILSSPLRNPDKPSPVCVLGAELCTPGQIHILES